jgi:hypothetical protein
MPAEPITVSLTGPLAEKVLAAAEACGLSPNEWAEMALRRRLDIERRDKAAREQGAGEIDS